ncbi:MAG TPA: MBL fold metallo-hydrolase [Syntrophomonadaceae bacterium]|nr:MBL fold metallo-hydrolase [Syntrophomonadaceae bacterium]
MEIAVTILVENSTPVPGLYGEYGFAALVDVNNRKYLFDTGSADALFANADAMQVNLAEITDVIISHGHFDHTGAMPRLISLGGIKHIYAHPDIFSHRLLPLGNGKTKDIGSRFDLEQVEKAGITMVYTEEFTELAPGINVTGMIPRLNTYEDTGGKFKVESEGKLEDDMLNDDMAMVIKHPDGLIIISGCAHSGIINTIEYAVKMTEEKRVLAFIGGTHLITAAQQRLDDTVQALKEIKPINLILSHCTGFHAAARLYHEFGPVVKKGETGMVFKF